MPHKVFLIVAVKDLANDTVLRLRTDSQMGIAIVTALGWTVKNLPVHKPAFPAETNTAGANAAKRENDFLRVCTTVFHCLFLLSDTVSF